jgi:hypothetical protein
VSALLERIVQEGNRSFQPHRIKHLLPNNIKCADGFELSVIAGEGTYCTPRPSAWANLAEVGPDYSGPYSQVEVGYPSTRPEPWHCGEWAHGYDRHEDHRVCDGWETYAEDAERPTSTVYAYVPVEMVRALIDSHGGER